ncbi:hypothetical protein H920_06450 [Fukomys damarensis]|uniref:Uncharacterized protein n=1 Tax=Fukomys damarensis TaxID=885580 RepID=A0A091DJ06_FUKDA|nr:hypothetical protein H920_06450 [Fukomys damarensis]
MDGGAAASEIQEPTESVHTVEE